MPLWLLLCSLPLQVLALEKTFGVVPDLVSRYAAPPSGLWKCLDGSKEIPWDFVNDDSCDCPDGSDEPGTGACPNTTFYCQNVGHIGATISSSRVKDGLCEPECCDGSDERPGVCKNICKAVGDVYKKKRAEQQKIQKTGSKIRSSYIVFARKEKIRLEALVQTFKDEIIIREKEVSRLRDIADRTESLSAAALEHKQQSPLYISLIEHSNALKSLQREHKKHLEREKALGDILDALRAGYNPNYQDMAVLEAVRGWEFLAGLPSSNERGKEDAEAEVQEEASAETTKPEVEEEVLPEGAWTADELENQLNPLLETDYVGLLLEHEEHIKSPPEGSIIFDLSAYLPESVVPQYEDFKDTLRSWLEKLGIVRGDSANADSSRARQAFQDAEHSLNKAKDDLAKTEKDISEIFSVTGFGAEGEWKKLDKTCLEKDNGEYTYEVCLFGEAKQKPNKGGSTFSLGKFSSWNPSPDVAVGSPEYYQKQMYQHGARCWNGPERSVILLLTCGTENALLTVTELEKCEYQITGTSPALCLPLDSTNGSRDEL
ncbi:glucosidase II beta subunit-like-domain-containing protein [Mycena floridula]|nr:glucosidase II beta subunit-like-domain-containing protein [Mycena floridula]